MLRDIVKATLYWRRGERDFRKLLRREEGKDALPALIGKKDRKKPRSRGEGKERESHLRGKKSETELPFKKAEGGKKKRDTLRCHR